MKPVIFNVGLSLISVGLLLRRLSRMKKQIIILSAILLIGFSHIACQAPSTESETIAIKKILLKDYLEAENAGNVNAKLALFTDDAVLMPPNEPTVSGRDAIRLWQQATYDQVTLQVTDSIEELKLFGDWGFARGSYTADVSLKAGGVLPQEDGKFLVIIKRQPDGIWKIARDMWSSNTSSANVQ
jgi:uncharacterized protein (TIGR02246 family)